MLADAADLETLNSRDFFGESSLNVASRMGLSEVANKLVERMARKVLVNAALRD